MPITKIEHEMIITFNDECRIYTRVVDGTTEVSVGKISPPTGVCELTPKEVDAVSQILALSKKMVADLKQVS